MTLPRRNNEVVQVTGPRGGVLNVKRLKGGSYFARVRGTQLARRGDEAQITEDVEHFRKHGTLPEREVLSGLRRTVPGTGSLVRFEPSAASLQSYTQHPDVGETGHVVQVPMGRRKVHYLPGPGGGQLYVRWERSGTIGVSLFDIT